MSSKNDFFLREKTKEITCSLLDENSDMYDSIGSVQDLFSSPYNNSPVASDETIEGLWLTLLDVFFKSKSYENRFDAISTLSDIYFHCIRCNKKLNLNTLKEWRSENNDSNSSKEILECVDNMII